MAMKPDIMCVKFTENTHHAPYPAIEIHSKSLPSPFNVCIIRASHDIGANIAYSFATAGATAIAICAPQAESAQVEAFPTTIQDSLGRIDALVYNVGYSGLWETRTPSTPHDFATALDVNCKGL